MKIMAVCGSGLGSSFMMEMNIKKIIKKLNITSDVEHADLGSVSANDADVFVMAKDIASSSGIASDKIIVLNNLLNMEELEQKLVNYFTNTNDLN